jgi:hypothetical protein
VATTFDPKLPGESEVFSLDFAARLGAGQTVAGATVTATPAGLTLGAPSVSGSVVSVRVSGGTGGVTFDLECLATLNDGSVVGYCTPLKVTEC